VTLTYTRLQIVSIKSLISACITETNKNVRTSSNIYKSYFELWAQTCTTLRTFSLVPAHGIWQTWSFSSCSSLNPSLMWPGISKEWIPNRSRLQDKFYFYSESQKHSVWHIRGVHSVLGVSSLSTHILLFDKSISILIYVIRNGKWLVNLIWHYSCPNLK
jgi:hypothetical protein